MIIDHIGFGVADFEKSKRFYTSCLAPLGITLIREEGNTVGFGKNSKAMYWFGPSSDPCKKMHVAFIAENRSQVDEFYSAALAAGGTANGAPGIRDIYHSDYYGAFVLDPDGHNVEAVCHKHE